MINPALLSYESGANGILTSSKFYFKLGEVEENLSLVR